MRLTVWKMISFLMHQKGAWKINPLIQTTKKTMGINALNVVGHALYTSFEDRLTADAMFCKINKMPQYILLNTCMTDSPLNYYLIKHIYWWVFSQLRFCIKSSKTYYCKHNKHIPVAQYALQLVKIHLWQE